MTRKLLFLTAACAVALAVSACGRKGKLEPPTSSSLAPTPAVIATV